MKRKLTLTRRNIVFLTIVLYVVVLFFGISLSSGITWAKNSKMVDIALRDMNYYDSHNGEFDPNVIKFQSNNFLYGKDGSLLSYSVSDNLDSGFDYDAYARSLQGKLTGKDHLYTITYDKHLTGRFALVVALPRDDGSMFMLFRHNSNLYYMLTVMFFTVTFAAALVGVFLMLLYNKNQRFQKIQREYVDNISHELKSPLSSIRALTETMNDGLVKDEEKEKLYYRIILGEVNRLEKQYPTCWSYQKSKVDRWITVPRNCLLRLFFQR